MKLFALLSVLLTTNAIAQERPCSCGPDRIEPRCVAPCPDLFVTYVCIEYSRQYLRARENKPCDCNATFMEHRCVTPCIQRDPLLLLPCYKGRPPTWALWVEYCQHHGIYRQCK
jgi:hypothetical protein